MNSLKEIKWYKKIKTKIIFSLAITITTVMVIAGLLSYNYIKNYETERLTKFAKVTADRLSKSLAAPMWNIDRVQIDELVTTELNEEIIVGIIAKDEGDRGVFSSKKRNSSGRIIDLNGSFENNDIRISRDVVRDSQVIGSIELFITKDFLNNELNKFAVSSAILVLILFAVIFLLMNTLLSKIVIRPLLGLADITDSISRGRLDQELNINSKDEIGYLTESFRKMQTSLRMVMGRLSSSAKSSPESHSILSIEAARGISEKIRHSNKLPSLKSIFKFSKKHNIDPDELISIAWKEWKEK